MSRLEEMIKLYGGEFLQHFYTEGSVEFEDWTLVHREVLHQHMMDALAWLANEYELRGDLQGARSSALRQLELDPWREEAHCRLMRVLALDGQRSAALAQFDACQRVLAEKLGVEPSRETREVCEQIRLGTLSPKPDRFFNGNSAPIHNLPVALTPFFGRERELSDLARLIVDRDCRCITLVGPGGIGKTRLALQTADQHRDEFVDGVAFVSLASVGTGEAVIPAIANAIKFDFYGPSDPKIQLIRYLSEKRMLLLLDNTEHLLMEENPHGTVTELITEILQQAPQVKLLVTSREALNLLGEQTFEIQGLTFPKLEEMDDIEGFDAVALFIQRARQARSGFVLNVEDRSGVVRLCRLVEGMPLAIELAATWTRLLSPAEVVTEIEHSLDFLNAHIRDLPERHRSMRAVFDRSWQALSTDEKQVLARLSVFRGGFKRPAAEQVAGATLTILSSLVIHSLLRRSAVGRYDLHELIRQYAALKLAEDQNAQYSVEERHSLYYLGLLEKKNAALQGRHQKEILAELTAEMDNLRSAWTWSVAHQKIVPLRRASGALWYLFELHNWWKEGEVTLGKTAEAILAYIEDTRPKGDDYLIAFNTILAGCGYFKFRLGRSDEASAILKPIAAYLRTCVEPTAATHCLCYLGIVCWEQGKFSEAQDRLNESLSLAKETGERWYEASAGEFFGVVAHEQGDYPGARQHLSSALAIFQKLGDPSMIAHVLSYLGRTMRVLGEYSEAEKLLRASVEIAREIDYRAGVGLALDALGLLMSAQDRHAEALALFSESSSLFREVGDTYRQSRGLNHQGLNYLALNQPLQAQNAFTAALRIARQGGYIPSALDSLAGLAALDTKQKASGATLELVLYILQHQTSTQEAKDLAKALRLDLEARLSQEEFEAAQHRVGTKSLDELVNRVLDNV